MSLPSLTCGGLTRRLRCSRSCPAASRCFMATFWTLTIPTDTPRRGGRWAAGRRGGGGGRGGWGGDGPVHGSPHHSPMLPSPPVVSASPSPSASVAASWAATPSPLSPDAQQASHGYRRISNGEIAEVARRHYQLQPWAIQLLLHDGETILLAVGGGQVSRDELCERLRAIIPRLPPGHDSSSGGSGGLRGVDGGGGGGVARGPPPRPSSMLMFSSAHGGGGGSSARRPRRAPRLTEAWQRGLTTNFEYLMQLNHVAGRCSTT